MNKLTKLIRFGLVMGFMLASVSIAFAQTQTVNGRVVDDSGQPIIGATVEIKGTSTGTVSDADGKFSVNASPKDVIVISYLGYTKQEIAVGRKTSFDVTLKEEVTQMKDVVVVGYGTQKKADLTGAVSTVDVAKSLEAKPFTDIAKGLQGVVPGLQITYSNGDITSAPSLQIRGLTSLNGAVAPLILVDGIATDDITSIAPNDIASISVLKDAASTSIFGARAVGGVIMITTKSGQKNTKFTINYTDNFSWGSPTVIPSFPDPLVELPMENAAMQRSGLGAFDFWGADLNDMITGITNWKQNYAGKESGNNMILGQDFSTGATGKGPTTFYRLWDPVKIMFQTMPSQNHNINFSGGTDRLSYYVSGSYGYNEGILKPNPQKLNTYNLTASVTAEATKWLTLQAKITDRQYDLSGPFVSSGLVGSDVLYTMWRWGSYVPYGTYNDPASGKDYYWDSPLGWLKTAGTSTARNNTSTSNISATIKFAPWLNLHSDFSYRYGSTLSNQYGGATPMWDFWGNWTGSPVTYNPIMQQYLYSTNGSGDFYQTSFVTQLTSNSYMTFEKKFGPHNLKAMVGMNAEKGETTKFGGGGYNLIDPSQGEVAFLLNTDPYGNTVQQLYGGAGALPINSTHKEQFISGDHYWWSVAGYFARINYDYLGKYLLEVSARYDGSSYFPINGRWAFFPSASAGWRITEESFMKEVKKAITDWKIRASYGTIGNQNVMGSNSLGKNYFSPIMASGNTNWLTTGSTWLPYVGLPQNIPASLTWERVNTLDIGTDMRFLNNNLGLTFDWYRKDNVGMLTQGEMMPSPFGAATALVNDGNLRTNGWEVGLDYHFQLHNGIQLYANAALSNYITKVISFGGNDAKVLNNYYVGETLGEIWGFKTVGYFKDANDVANSPDQSKLQSGSFVFGPGDVKYADLNGDGKIDWGGLTATDHGDLTKIGNTTPQYQYSFRLGGSWKGVDLDVFFQGVGECQMWATGNVAIPGYGGNGQFLGNQMDYWTADNPNAQWPALYYGNNISNIPNQYWWARPMGTTTITSAVSGNNFYPQSKYLLNMAYLRLKTLTLGYTMPTQLTEKIRISKFRIYVEGMNLLTFWANQIPIDPEITSSASSAGAYYGITYPFNKTYSFGVQITF